MAPSKPRDDLGRFLAALDAAGYRVTAQHGRQPAVVEASGRGDDPDLRLLVYLWPLRGSGVSWPRRELRVVAHRPGGARLDLTSAAWTLLLGYDGGRDVYAAWRAASRPDLAQGASLRIPVATLDAARTWGIAFHRPRSRDSAELVAAFRPDALRDYLDSLAPLARISDELTRSGAVEGMPEAGSTIILGPDLEAVDALDDLGDVGVVAPSDELSFEAPPPLPRARWRGRVREAPVRQVPNRRKDVATGFSPRAHPGSDLDPATPLETETEYWFWFEIGALVGSIEEKPEPVPEAVPVGAQLTVQLFGFPGELVLEPGRERGVIELERDGTAHVIEHPTGTVPLRTTRDRRLRFPITTPSRSGDCRLRCNMYHGATLVQSRLVRAQVGGEPRPGRRALRSAVDYSLTPRVSAGSAVRLPSHTLSLQLNGTGGTHQMRFFGADGDRDFVASPTIDRTSLGSLIRNARGALRNVAWNSIEDYHEGMRYRYGAGVTPTEFEHDLIALALAGYRLYDGIIDDLSEDRAAELAELMLRPGVVQIATSKPNDYVPAALFYDYPLYDGPYTADTFSICPTFRAALAAATPLAQTPCVRGECPSRDEVRVVCPSGFWGYRHEVGWPVSSDDDAYTMRFEGRPRMTIGISTDLELSEEHAARVRALGDGDIVRSSAELFDEMRAGGQHLVYLYCHGGIIGDSVPFVEIGAAKSDSITRASLRALNIRWDRPRPLVFINGCHTTALEPERAIDLVSGFVRTANALGVIGTEITVFESLACAFAEQMLGGFMDGTKTAGAATREARLALLAARNPLGLVYVPFVAAGAQLITDAQE